MSPKIATFTRSPPVDAQFCLAPPHSFPRLPRPAHFVSFDTARLLSKGKHGRRRKTYQGSLASLNNQSYHNETCIGSWQWGLSWCWLTGGGLGGLDRKSTRLNSSHVKISYAVFCLKK